MTTASRRFSTLTTSAYTKLLSQDEARDGHPCDPSIFRMDENPTCLVLTVDSVAKVREAMLRLSAVTITTSEETKESAISRGEDEEASEASLRTQAVSQDVRKLQMQCEPAVFEAWGSRLLMPVQFLRWRDGGTNSSSSSLRPLPDTPSLVSIAESMAQKIAVMSVAAPRVCSQKQIAFAVDESTLISPGFAHFVAPRTFVPLRTVPERWIPTHRLRSVFARVDFSVERPYLVCEFDGDRVVYGALCYEPDLIASRHVTRAWLDEIALPVIESEQLRTALASIPWSSETTTAATTTTT